MSTCCHLTRPAALGLLDAGELYMANYEFDGLDKYYSVVHKPLHFRLRSKSLNSWMVKVLKSKLKMWRV